METELRVLWLPVEWQRPSPRVLLLALAAASCLGCERAAESPAAPWSDVIEVRDATILLPQLHAQRIPVGVPHDCQPNLVLLPSGGLLLVMYQPVSNPDGTAHDDMILYRSADGGQTWGSRQILPLLGREPYFSLLRDGTLFLTAQFLASDQRNTAGYDYAVVYRSSDAGLSWSTLPILAENLPGVAPRTPTRTSRNLLELEDGTLVMGVSAGSSSDYLWRSFDQGQTWNKSLASQVQGFDVAARGRPWYGEMLLFEARSGDLLGIARTAANALPPFANTEAPLVSEDTDRMVLFRSSDAGRTWRLGSEIGDYYGEMYPSLLRLGDSRLLFTFTVSAMRPPFGVQALLGVERLNGFSLNFATDRLLLDQRTPPGQPSGGGFGNTVRFPGGLLATAYSYRGADAATHAEVVRWVLPYYPTVADAWAH
jgi:hypothetical protein